MATHIYIWTMVFLKNIWILQHIPGLATNEVILYRPDMSPQRSRDPEIQDFNARDIPYDCRVSTPDRLDMTPMASGDESIT